MKITKDYWDLVKAKAHDLGTDGCTLALPAFRKCCLRHDVENRTKQSAVSGRPLTNAEIDARLLACMQAHSWLGWYSPIAWLYYLSVTQIGRKVLKIK